VNWIHQDKITNEFSQENLEIRRRLTMEDRGNNKFYSSDQFQQECHGSALIDGTIPFPSKDKMYAVSGFG
jgi:hypothetical protein